MIKWITKKSRWHLGRMVVTISPKQLYFPKSAFTEQGFYGVCIGVDPDTNTWFMQAVKEKTGAEYKMNYTPHGSATNNNASLVARLGIAGLSTGIYELVPVADEAQSDLFELKLLGNSSGDIKQD